MTTPTSSRFSRLRAVVLKLHVRSSFCGISSNTCCAPVCLLQRWLSTSAGDTDPSSSTHPPFNRGSFDISTRKIVDSRAVGIKSSVITAPTWRVLTTLRKKGFRAYLVGGCVRDLLLKKAPRDFDVITTASLEQIKSQFDRSVTVGHRRFPICLVFLPGSMVEVSSFDTSLKNSKNKEEALTSRMPEDCNMEFVRWRNCMERDFTINSLFYDPFANVIYDYAHGIDDLSTSKVNTVIPAHLSFKEDCVRILRGLRIAARLGLKFSKETAAAIMDHSSSISTLSKQRLMMELEYMLAYGAAESSIRLLQKFKLLQFLLPFHAAYLADQSRKQSGENSIMLLKLFSNVDKLLAADRPSSCFLWLSVLALHLALVCHPQDALVLQTFSSILYHGSWMKAMPFTRESSKVQFQFLPEILDPSGAKSDEQLLEESSHFASLVRSSVHILTDYDALMHSLARYQEPLSCSALVLVSKNMGKKVSHLFDMLETDIKSFSNRKEKYNIDYKQLKKGDPHETRFALGKIILETINGEHELTPKPSQSIVAGERNHLLEFACGENRTVTAVEKNCLDRTTEVQHQKVAAGDSSARHTRGQKQNKHHRHRSGQNQSHCNSEIFAIVKNHESNHNVSVAEKSLHELPREQNQKELAAERVNSRFNGEQNKYVAVKEKRRTLSAFFK